MVSLLFHFYLLFTVLFPPTLLFLLLKPLPTQVTYDHLIVQSDGNPFHAPQNCPPPPEHLTQWTISLLEICLV